MEVPEKPTVKWKSEGKVNQKFVGVGTGPCSEEPFEEVKLSPVLFMHKEAARKIGISEDSFRPANENWNTKGKKKILWPNQSDM